MQNDRFSKIKDFECLDLVNLISLQFERTIFHQLSLEMLCKVVVLCSLPLSSKVSHCLFKRTENCSKIDILLCIYEFNLQ